MAAPAYISITTKTFTSDATSHLVTMPATVNPYDTLIVILAVDGDTFITTPTNWTAKGSRVATDSGGKIFVFAKVADGSEDGTNVDFVTAAAEKATSHTYRISGGYRNSNESGIETVFHATGGQQSTGEPSSLSPSWGSADVLWIAASSCSDDNVTSITSYSSGYSGGTFTSGGADSTNTQLASCYKTSTASSEDPGAITANGAARFQSVTIAIRPTSVFSMAGSLVASFAGSALVNRIHQMLGLSDTVFGGASDLRGGVTLMEGSIGLTFGGGITALQALYNMIGNSAVTFAGVADAARLYNMQAEVVLLFFQATDALLREQYQISANVPVTFGGSTEMRTDQDFEQIPFNDGVFTLVVPNTDTDFTINNPNADPNSWTEL